MLITKNLNSEANIAHSFDVNQNYLTTSDGKANIFSTIIIISLKDHANYEIVLNSSLVLFLILRQLMVSDFEKRSDEMYLS